MVYDNIASSVGNTPLVLLNKSFTKLECNLYAKCEFLNPGGSTKDRIAYAMVVDAQNKGLIKPGDTLIEASSGNTGIGLAMVGASLGYKVIITMPEKMSIEKQKIIEALGGKVIRTPTEVSSDHPDSHINKAIDLKNSLENAHILDQYSNQANPSSHYHTTAQEIFHDLDGQMDMIVVGVGTGGTISGIAKYIKDLQLDCVIVGVDPYGSILADEKFIANKDDNNQCDLADNPNQGYLVEGIGYDFIPDVLDRKLVDKWVKTRDYQSFTYARKLISEQGLLCGGSSGAVYCAALQQGDSLTKNQNCVMILSDGITNYLNKFVDDIWMFKHFGDADNHQLK